MNPDLSRRIGRVMDIIRSEIPDVYSFVRRVSAIETFGDLSKEDKATILSAESRIKH
jgi:hypothetical protein